MNETSRPDKPVMIYRKTAILQKNGIFAAVGVYSYLEFCYDAPGDGTAEREDWKYGIRGHRQYRRRRND